MRLTVKQLTAVLKAGLIVTNADGETKKEEIKRNKKQEERWQGRKRWGEERRSHICIND